MMKVSKIIGIFIINHHGKGKIMGYRSQVASIIYDTKENMDKFKADNSDGIKELESHFENNNDEGLSYQSNSDHDIIFLKGNDWKWYSTYTDVKAWHNLMNLAKEKGLSVEFIRVGEDYEDIEVDYINDSECYLNVERFIEATF